MAGNPLRRNFQNIFLAGTVFLTATFLLTFNIIHLPSLVIGDNFNWTPQNILDITGPRIIRESYMGDIAVLSTFKTGFLFPITYLLVSLDLPSTVVYPSLFYFLSMLCFYSLTKEFLRSEPLRLLLSLLYVINPVTPYYFASLINAFSLVLLPLGFKFFVRALKEIKQSSKPLIIKNFAITAFFLSLCVSANEQFVASILLLTLFMIFTFAITLYREISALPQFGKSVIANLAVFVIVFAIVNAPLFLSISNIHKASWSTYFQGPTTSRFLTTVDYTYRGADLTTLLRLGGDSGAGLGQNSWYDSSLPTNIFGYVVFAIFVLSIILMIKKYDSGIDRTFTYTTIFIFISALLLILLIKNLPANIALTGTPFDSLLKTWENPSKLRVILLISLLTSTFVLFKVIEMFTKRNTRLFLVILSTFLILVSAVIYNSPWLINYAGQTTMQQVADSLNWGELYQSRYADMTQTLNILSNNKRGIVLPYTHKTELYSEPASRVFQIVSAVNEQYSKLIAEENVDWSKTLGLLSIKSVALTSNYRSSEGLIFPSATDVNINQTLTEIRGASGFRNVTQTSDYLILDNQNALPLLYASNYFVYYEEVSILKYALPYVDFNDLPVFQQSSSSNCLVIPNYVNCANYSLYALSLKGEQTNPIMPLVIHGNQSAKNILLRLIDNSSYLSTYSSNCTLNPGDVITIEPQNHQTRRLVDVTLNSTSMFVDSLGSFTLDFSVNIVERGNASYLGPRVILDSGDKQYFIIIHDNGMIELAVMQNGRFHSVMITRFTGYTLYESDDSVNVRIVRNFDEINVYVSNILCMTFNISPKFTRVYLSSEHSTSLFSNVYLTKNHSIKLFAVRQNSIKLPYTVQQISPEKLALTIHGNASDFVVVSQYLYTDLTHVDNSVSSNEIPVNLFFKAWFFNQTNQQSLETYVSIGIENQSLMLGVVTLSITFSYVMLLLIIIPFPARTGLCRSLHRLIKNQKR